MSAANITYPSKTTYDKHQGELFAPAVNAYWTDMRSQNIEQSKKQQKVILAGDARLVALPTF